MASLARSSHRLTKHIKTTTIPIPRSYISLPKRYLSNSRTNNLCIKTCARRNPLPTTSFLARLFGTKHSAMSLENAKREAQSIIDNNKVAVFAKTYCPYCQAALSLLSSLDAKMEIVQLDKRDDGAVLQDALQEISGQRTVPNIFIGGKHIGGNSDLQAIKDKLPAMLKELGATQ